VFENVLAAGRRCSDTASAVLAVGLWGRLVLADATPRISL
jgi:hypothetical protein